MNQDSVLSNAKMGETISALADGEASELEVRRLLKLAESDPQAYEEALEGWRRTHLIGSLMRKEPNQFLELDISSSVSRAITDEDVPAQVAPSTKSKFGNWMETLGKTGIAAAIAVGVLVGVQHVPNKDASSDMLTNAPAVTPASNLAGAQAPEWFQSDPLSVRTVSALGAEENSVNVGKKVERVYIPQKSLPTTPVQDPKVQAHLDSILTIHAQNAASINSMKVLPLARAGSEEVK